MASTEKESLPITFPQYRKYKNGKSYFRINSMSSFEELKSMPGGGFRKYIFEVKILPDRNFLNDMLYEYTGFWEAIDEKEYYSVADQAVR